MSHNHYKPFPDLIQVASKPFVSPPVSPDQQLIHKIQNILCFIRIILFQSSYKLFLSILSYSKRVIFIDHSHFWLFDSRSYNDRIPLLSYHYSSFFTATSSFAPGLRITTFVLSFIIVVQTLFLYRKHKYHVRFNQIFLYQILASVSHNPTFQI